MLLASISIVLWTISFVCYSVGKILIQSTEYKKQTLALPINIFAFLVGLGGIYSFFLLLDAGA